MLYWHLQTTLKTLLRELFTNNGKILSWKSVKPCKTDKTHGRITLEQKINLAQIAHPSKATFRFPLPGPYAQFNAQGMSGGDVEALIWPVHNL